MTPGRIQGKLKDRGITQKAIAGELGVSEINISRVIHRKTVSDRIMRAVAEKIGKEPWDVFPEYYLQAPKRRTSKTLPPHVITALK